ncbi:IS3 family transposase [Kibdelosporangium aridum]|uniref:Putative transposase n=1 Tax=Kibdelosporangium aridum TaxID=2030 RepID=A0A1W2A7B1_KIBAR|nr:IS3 family transposase [Kibdelosporangium aridum]SMC56605.1 putative transposase [Kibdelosporangium aridum]
MKREILRVFSETSAGSRRIWRRLNSEGVKVARCTVERLMRELKISGGPRPTTTDGLKIRRWYVDFHSGALFVVDETARKIVAYERCGTISTERVLTALESALLSAAWHHGHTVITYSERLAASGVDITVGPVGESPMAQSMIQWYNGS